MYIARTGKTPRINVYNLDTLEQAMGTRQLTANGTLPRNWQQPKRSVLYFVTVRRQDGNSG